MNVPTSPVIDGAAAPEGGTMHAMLVPLLTVELLLLAFFILLNAVSNMETDRTRSVVESVRAAFGAAAAEDSEASPADRQTTLAEVEQQIATLTHAAGGVRGASPTQEDALWINLPLAALFRPGEDRLSTAQARFVERLTALLAQTPAGHAYEIAVLRGSADAASGDTALRLRQVGALAAALRGRAEPRATVVAGLLPDASVGVRLALSWRASDPVESR